MKTSVWFEKIPPNAEAEVQNGVFLQRRQVRKRVREINIFRWIISLKTKKPQYVEFAHLQKVSASEEGMTVEIYSKKNQQSYQQHENHPYPIVSFIATNDEVIWMELYIEGVPSRVRLEDIEKAIIFAKENVRSEEWFDRNTIKTENT